MVFRILVVAGLIVSLAQSATGSKEISRIWLSYNATRPQNIVMNWYSPELGNAQVELLYGEGRKLVLQKEETARLHHVSVPLRAAGGSFRYRVKTNDVASAWYTVRGSSAQEPVRVAVVADWGFAVGADMAVILKEKPDLLVTGGDNIQGLFLYGAVGDNRCVESYLRLVDSFPELFRTVPFMPALGNHDKQLYPRGNQSPQAYALYDTEAVAFREFFALPGKEWIWALDVPHTNVRLLALDLNHIRDDGTTWQSCHSFGPESEQYQWYKKEIECNPGKQIVTIYNGEHRTVRRMAGGIWKPLTQRADIIITGSGYFAEYAVIDKTPYLNTSLVAGDLYPDPLAEYSSAEASYVMITADSKSARVVLKRLADGKVLYATNLPEK